MLKQQQGNQAAWSGMSKGAAVAGGVIEETGISHHQNVICQILALKSARRGIHHIISLLLCPQIRGLSLQPAKP